MADTTRKQQSQRKTAVGDQHDTTEAQASQREAGTPTATAADSGPGTGQDAPQDTQARTPDRAVAGQSDPQAAPLVAPDAATQTQPEGGYVESSTNPVAAASGVRPLPGENHVQMVDEHGQAVSPQDLFTDPGGPQTFVTAKQRVYEQFTYPHSSQRTQRLFMPAGQRVNRGEAERIKAALTGPDQQPTFGR